MAGPKPLSPQQLKFVGLYLKGGSAKQAYIDAGYKARGHAAEVNAERLLRNAEVERLVAEARKEGEGKAGVTAAWWYERMRLEAEREGEGASHAARVAALKVLAQAMGLLTENVQVSGPGGGAIQVEGTHEHRYSATADDVAAARAVLGRRALAGGVPPDGRSPA